VNLSEASPNGWRRRVGYAAAGAILFAVGIAFGTTITRSPIQSRMPGGGAPPMLPTLLPFGIAALSFPFFVWLAHRVPLSRAQWRRALPLWLLSLVVIAFFADALVFALIAGGMPRLEPFPFLVMRLITTGPLIAMSAAAAIAIENANARALLVQAQLRSLTAQLRPHFLFNTLQSISTLVHRDSIAADRMIGQLADLLRASLDLDDRTLVPLHRELEITQTYLAIVQERFGARLHVDVQSSATPDLLVPPFLLQPLVENAVQHGVESSAGGGTVGVRAFEAVGQLILEVRDSGGAPASTSTRPGIGLPTTRQRLAAIYGNRAELTMATTPDGTVVTVRLPVES
jgi:two-component system LytT family sensor kinase